MLYDRPAIDPPPMQPGALERLREALHTVLVRVRAYVCVRARVSVCVAHTQPYTGLDHVCAGRHNDK